MFGQACARGCSHGRQGLHGGRECGHESGTTGNSSITFTKGKSQLDPVDVEKTRGIANVRIHVERLIGLLRRKYAILEGTLPTDFLVSSQNAPPVTDRVIRVCAALVNLCPPILPYD